MKWMWMMIYLSRILFGDATKHLKATLLWRHGLSKQFTLLKCTRQICKKVLAEKVPAKECLLKEPFN